MYCITDEQITYILNDIRRNGVEMEELQLNLLDHVCCIVEQNLKADDDFERFYHETIKQFYKTELREIEVETINLLTFKNYYTMKKVMIISGTVAATAFVFGSFFKAMFWPGANVLLFLAIMIFSFIFLPLMAILKSRDVTTSRDKLVTALGTLLGFLYAMSTLFAVMHWPGAKALWITTVSVSAFVFIPVYFFTGIRKPESKLNTIVTTVIMVGATGLLFTMIALRPKRPETQLYTYVKNEALLKEMQRRHSDNNSNKLVADINASCEQIKGLILEHATGKATLPTDAGETEIKFDENNLGMNGFGGNEHGLHMLSVLKQKVNAYNATQQGEGKIPIDHSILTAPEDQVHLYNNIYALNNLAQLQMYLASAADVQAVTMK